MSRIDDLMSRFTALPGSMVGRGPRHPIDPDPAVEPLVQRFLTEYPDLRADSGYVEFLEKYAGASIENDDPSQIIDVLGFSDVSTEIDEMDGPLVDSQGFLVIIDAVYHIRDGGRTTDTVQHSYAFSVVGRRSRGIYHSVVSRQNLKPDFSLQFNDFVSLLGDLVNRGGWFDPPGPPMG